MYPTRVFLVKEGCWGEMKPEDYQVQIEMYRQILEEAKDTQESKAAEVTVIDTIEEAEKRLKMEADVVVFISRGVEREAERIARENPNVRVIVFTGLIPKGKVIWVDKAMTMSRETIEDIVLHYSG